jgi:hypothetical protein
MRTHFSRFVVAPSSLLASVLPMTTSASDFRACFLQPPPIVPPLPLDNPEWQLYGPRQILSIPVRNSFTAFILSRSISLLA